MSDAVQPNDLKQFVDDVERDLLTQIVTNMKHRDLTVAEAQQLAKDFLATLPVHDKLELLNKLSDLGKKHREAQTVYVKYASPIYEQDRQRKLQLMSQHIKNGNIEEALKVAKEGMWNVAF